MKESWIDVGIGLALDAAVLVKSQLRQYVKLYGLHPLEELFQFAVDHQIPVYGTPNCSWRMIGQLLTEGLVSHQR